MKRLNFLQGLCLPALALACLITTGCGSASEDSVKLNGAGASFPAPLYDRWFKDYNAAHPEVQINYQSIGSGGGIKNLQSETVDFGASDAAMTDDEMAEVKRGVTLLPMTAGSIVLAFNLEGGPEELKLSRQAYADIFLGKITNWNDPAIAATNEGSEFPDQPITVVVRADSSGTTFVFTQHLSAISEAFSNGPGTGKTVNWADSDKLIKAKKNDGVAANIKNTPGAIGYVEFGFAEQAKLPVASLENKAGKFSKPTIESFQAALAGVEMPTDLRLFLPDPEGEQSYPIVSYTWLLVYNKYDNAKTPAALFKVIEYCLTDGQKISQEMGYIPLPESVVKKVLTAAEAAVGGGSEKADDAAGEKAA